MLRLCEVRNVTILLDHDQFLPATQVAYVRTGTCKGPELFCSSGPGLMQVNETLTEAPPGDYFLFVDNEVWGSVRLSAPGCSAPGDLEIDAGLRTFSPSAHSDDVDLPTMCSESLARNTGDLGLRFTLAAPATLHARLASAYCRETWCGPTAAVFQGECLSSLVKACGAHRDGGITSFDLPLDAGSFLLTIEAGSTGPINVEAWVD